MGKQYLNGVLYGTGEIIKFSPYIYSLEEREVGVHTNGKPLYEKTYRWTISDLHNSDIQSGNMYGEFWLDHVAYDEFWMCDTKIVNKGTYWRIKSVSSNTPHESIVIARSNIQTYQTTNDGYPFIFFKTTDSSAYIDKNSLTFYYTIRYTKTTDPPGSRHYTTKGGEAHHYSTSEQIVGTWIDGKPLYEKIVEITNIGTGKQIKSHGISNVDTMIVKHWQFYNGSNNIVGFENPSDSNWYAQVLEVNGSTLTYKIGGGWSATKLILILQYTKTTD